MGGEIMSNNQKATMILLLDDINEIVNSTIMCFTNPHYILGKKELVLSLLTIETKINKIKFLLRERI